MNRLMRLWRAARLPLTFLIVIAVLHTLWPLFQLPPRGELIPLIKSLLAVYGLPLVFVGAFLESLLLIGWYFPGGFIIFLAVILSPSLAYAIAAVIVVTIGLYLGYIINFVLGRHGWHRLLVKFGIRTYLDEAERRVALHGGKAIVFSYWSPGLAAFVSTAAGILHYPFRKFLLFSFASLVIWNTVWGTLAYNIGEHVLDIVFSWWLVIVGTVVWIAMRLWEQRQKGRVTTSTQL